MRMKLREIPGAVGHYAVGSILVLYRLVRIGAEIRRDTASQAQ